MLEKILRGVLTLVLACASVAAAATPYTSITVFGDSLSDGGNAYAYTEAIFGSGNGFPPAPYAQRFSNGPVAVERLAANLGLSLAPSLLGGSNYAYGGAETGSMNYLRFNSNPLVAAAFSGSNTGVLAQVADFTSLHSLNPSSLVVLWAGPNDLFSALDSSADPVAAMSLALFNLQLAAQQLYLDGARTILMPNMPNIGLTPFGLSLGAAASAQLTGISVGFNAGLHLLADALNAADPGLNILEFDTFSLLDSLINNPADYGFSNVTQPCFNGVAVCANPDSYLFWDSVHPTASAHQLIGDRFTITVPEPPLTALMAVALIALYASRRRKR
ncbi:SGNH/GDSL hydrolase family protein [Rhodoferax ferrireducens]|uniref:SGNH/GDSL hydrolase family protein n=1 Tax=Rhodoferax ferrireducens TaxID=192843 RepID=UPI003BB559B3